MEFLRRLHAASRSGPGAARPDLPVLAAWPAGPAGLPATASAPEGAHPPAHAPDVGDATLATAQVDQVQAWLPTAPTSHAMTPRRDLHPPPVPPAPLAAMAAPMHTPDPRLQPRPEHAWSEPAPVAPRPTDPRRPLDRAAPMAIGAPVSPPPRPALAPAGPLRAEIVAARTAAAAPAVPAPPVVQVKIDRLDVRLPPERAVSPPGTPRRPTRADTTTSLADYLRGRTGGRS